MLVVEDESLFHANARVYNAAKAHEYYMKRRHLHPRPHGVTYTVKTASGKTERVSAKQLAEQKAYAAQRVAHMKTKLGNLKVLLHQKLREAHDREAKAKKPPTLAEKAKAAREAEKYRKSHKSSIAAKAKVAADKAPASKKPAEKVDTVDSLKKEIGTVKTNLKNAVARQRALATAKQNG